MPRTPFAALLRDAAADAAAAAIQALPVEEVIEWRNHRTLTRRTLLKSSAGLAAAATLTQMPRRLSAQGPRIVVVGAGLAGLTAALRLRQAGYVAQVYEAADRVGGRCWTLRGAFDQGQIVERGGELIDQSHTQIRQLAQELGLQLDNLLQAETNGTEPFYYFDGAPYTYADATRDLKEVWQKLHKDLSAASYPTLYNLYTPRGWELDHMSIIDWINESVPGGLQSRLGQLLDVAYNIEYGGESAEQSSLNLLYLLGFVGQGQLRIFGPSNEKYHVAGGNDQITTRMADLLAGQVALGQELVAIRQQSNGVYTLTFRSGRKTRDVDADKVVLALPFSILRNSVDIRRAGFNELKQTAIRELPMGTNSKLQLQFTDRHWDSLGCNGDSCSDTGYQCSWHVTRGQPGAAGILVNYTGGAIGASFGQGKVMNRAQQFLGQIESVLPGISAKWNGRATLDFWAGNPWTRGSYSYWKVGQYTRFAGAERERSGHCHFAGEHTSVDFQGYLNGAVESGERAAAEVLADLR